MPSAERAYQAMRGAAWRVEGHDHRGCVGDCWSTFKKSLEKKIIIKASGLSLDPLAALILLPPNLPPLGELPPWPPDRPAAARSARAAAATGGAEGAAATTPRDSTRGTRAASIPFPLKPFPPHIRFRPAFLPTITCGPQCPLHSPLPRSIGPPVIPQILPFSLPLWILSGRRHWRRRGRRCPSRRPAMPCSRRRAPPFLDPLSRPPFAPLSPLPPLAQAELRRLVCVRAASPESLKRRSPSPLP